jgi:hypothetical protein
MKFFARKNNIFAPLMLLAAVGLVTIAPASNIHASAYTASRGNLGIIKGIVRDQGGNPIADATVALFRVGTTKVLREVRSAADGSFLLRILPGKYTVLAVAQGFNPVTLPDVEINRASELSYGFKLERAGSGNTLPEKRLDRNNPKWVRRSASISRSIYQNTEGSQPIAGETVEETVAVAEREADESARPGESVAETYFASSDKGNYLGINYATLIPVRSNAEVLLAIQAGIGKASPLRVESKLKYRPLNDHQIRVNTSFASLGSIAAGDSEDRLGQFSVQALDEWRVREGVIFVYGVDYSRFVGAGNDFSISPRLGLQFDIDSKTRFRTSYTSQTEERTWAREIELEDAQVLFREPASIQDLVISEGRPVMGESRRLEFGIERVLDNYSSIEVNAFFDTTAGRGVGLMSLPFDSSGAGFSQFVGEQNGGAQGLRLVYSRRLGSRFTTSGGYSFGTGQKLSENGLTNPADLFETDVFHSFFGQFEADLRTGTTVKTVFRLSPDATVFAIDPFRGRLAIYDPSLSILVTQNLPSLGLPIRAEATVDARNIFDFHGGVTGEEGGLRFNSQRRMLRGGILVRF